MEERAQVSCLSGIPRTIEPRYVTGFPGLIFRALTVPGSESPGILQPLVADGYE